jgi:hypothetical protein
VGADEVVEAVVGGDGVGVAEVLDDLQRAPEREHLGAADVLDVVGELLEVAVVVEGQRHRVCRAGVDRLDAGADRADASLDLAALAAQALGELEVLMAVGLRELDVHDVAVGVGAVERVAGRVRAAVLHGLEHARHVAPDLLVAVPVAIDDPCDPAHG